MTDPNLGLFLYLKNRPPGRLVNMQYKACLPFLLLAILSKLVLVWENQSIGH